MLNLIILFLILVIQRSSKIKRMINLNLDKIKHSLFLILLLLVISTDVTAQCGEGHCVHPLDFETILAQEGIKVDLSKITPSSTPLLRSSSTNHVSPARVEFILTHDGPALLGMTETQISNNILQLGNFFETCNSLANFDHPCLLYTSPSPRDS